MQKKIKRGLIITSVSIILITLTLVLLGLAKVNLNQNALNYSTVTANYSDTKLYGPGLYWIGIANQFIRFNKNQQTLRFNSLSAFSSDFYKITANMEVTLQFNFPEKTSFAVATKFLQLFGQNPLYIIEPLVKNQILIALSSQNSQFYQYTSQPNSVLESQLASIIGSVLQQWISTSVIVIVQSVICEGTTSNTQIVDRQIQSLINDLQRTAQEQVQLTGYFNTTYNNKLQQTTSAYDALSQKALQLNRIYGMYGTNATGYNISRIIYDNKPLKYNMNLVDILEQLALVANRTFPY